LALRLHVLASIHGNQLHLDPAHRKVVQPRNGLETLVDCNLNLTNKFDHVAQAITSLCTAQSGAHNFAVMFGFSTCTGEASLFFAQNAGPKPEEITTHLHNLWAVLQKIRQAASFAPPSIELTPSMPSPHTTPTESDLIKELVDLGYAFVFEKVLNRARKRHPA
jgi:hypothetical protein